MNTHTTASALLAALALGTSLDAQSLTCDGSVCRLQVHEYLTFEAPGSFFTELPDGGFRLQGNVNVVTPVTSMPLPQADLTFQPVELDGPIDFEVYGSVYPDLLTLPGLGQYFGGAPLATFGVATRETLQEMFGQEEPLPLTEVPSLTDPDVLMEPAYMFLHFDSNVTLDLPMADVLGLDPEDLDLTQYGLPEGETFMLVIDPMDPFFYFAKDDMLASDEEPSSDTSSDTDDDDAANELDAVGFSWLGGIPFDPENTWGLPEGTGEFTGNVLLDGKVTIHGVQIDGDVVASVTQQSVQIGANGKATIEIPKPGSTEKIELPVGQASVGIEIGTENVETYVSGLMEVNEHTLPADFPFAPTGQLKVAAHLGTNAASLAAEGDFDLEVGSLGQALGLSLEDAISVEGGFSISSAGIDLHGTAQGTIHPDLAFGGALSVAAHFPADMLTWYVSLAGELTMGGVDLGYASVLMNPNGLFIDGAYTTPMTTIELTGEFTSAGPYLAGYAIIDLGAEGLGQALANAQAAVANAQAYVNDMTAELNATIAWVEEQREAQMAALQNAQDAVNVAQDVVNELQSEINYHNSQISYCHKQIGWKYSWYKSQAWYNKTWAWGVYVGYKSAKYSQIAWHNTAIAGLVVAKGTANGILWTAEQTLALAESALDTFPIELAPAVVAVKALQEAAIAGLNVAEAALSIIPPLPDDFTAEIFFELDHSGLTGSALITLQGTELLGGELSVGQYVELSVVVPVVGEVSVTI